MFHYTKKITLFLFLVYLIADLFIGRILLNWGYVYSKKESTIERCERPYIEFTGKPLALDHNEMGYRGESIATIHDSSYVILFFAGSTGYYGAPPIPNLLEEQLIESTHQKIHVINASVVSANHNQHLHAIVEQFLNYPVDMVIFYGGYNENIQPLYYDPRPGYPFNYYYKSEAPCWVAPLLKYSSVFGELEKRFRIVSGINTYRKRYTSNTAEWHRKIKQNYINVLQRTALIVEHSMKNKQGTPTKFIAFYQPYNVPDSYLHAHNSLRKECVRLPFWIDLTDKLHAGLVNKKAYIDDVHVNQNGNEYIAEEITKHIIPYVYSPSRVCDN